MRRWSGAGAIATLVLLAAFTALASLLGGGPARASSTPDQVFGTNPPSSTTPSSSPPSEPPSTATPATVRPVVTTVAVATTRARASGTTAPARVIAPTPYTTPRSRYQTPTTPPPTTAPATTTTILGIGGRLPTAPVTLPLHTQSSNGHVNPAFAWLSGAGFAIALILVGYRLFATRPGGRDRAPVG